MDGKIKIATDIGVGAFDNVKMVFGSERSDMRIGRSGGDKDCTGASLIEDRFNAVFKEGAFLIGENNEGVEIILHGFSYFDEW